VPRAISHLLLVAILSALAVTPAAGRQTTPVLNPKVVEFDPSADHAATTATGEPMVSRYELQLILLGASQPMTTVSPDVSR